MFFRRFIWICAGTAALCLTGCAGSSSEQVEEIGAPFSSEADGSASDVSIYDGFVEYGVCFQGLGVSTTAAPLKYFAWDDQGFQVICTDPDCAHEKYNELRNPEPACGAVYASGINTNMLSFLYNGERIKMCIEKYDWYETDVYAAQADGTEAELALCIDGMISNRAVLLKGDTLYGTLEAVSQTDKVEREVEENVYCPYYPLTMLALNLTDYTVRTYQTDMMSADGFDEFVCAKDRIYARTYDRYDDQTTIYAFSEDLSEGEAILSKQEGEGHLFGCIGSMVFYTKGDPAVYAWDSETGKTVYICDAEGMECASACVVGSRLAVCNVDADGNTVYKLYTAPGVYDETVSYGQTDMRLFCVVGEWMLLKETTATGTEYLYAPGEDLTQYVQNARHLCNKGGSKLYTGEGYEE